MSSVLVERDSLGVVTLTLNRPEKRNALDRGAFQAIIAACDEIENRRADRVLMITGAGTAFCSGADLSAGAASGSTRSPSAAPDTSDETPDAPTAAFGRGVGASLRLMRLVSACALRLHSLSKPTIAVVNGPAVGAGCNLALCCDLVLASTDARFGEIFVNRALSLDFAGSWLLPRRIGLHKAKELAFVGDLIDARTAFDLGLLNRLCAPESLLDDARELAHRIARQPPLALSIIKAQLNNSVAPALAAALPLEELAQALAVNSLDARAALTALRDHTDPEFSGE